MQPPQPGAAGLSEGGWRKPDNESTKRIRRGQLSRFLRRNYFVVRLNDGQEIVAVMPEKFFGLYTPGQSLRVNFSPGVNVVMSKPK